MNWGPYINSHILEQFTKETGIKVIYSTYESNETLYAKLKKHIIKVTTWWCLPPISLQKNAR
ncbi:hypothetical protein QW180_19455 [Vibrio sinaloensis]|nr:hypothetical protein [Vibrio sinaloensis]